MTRECAPGGIPTLAMTEYYRRRAEGGAGLIITEGASPSLEGSFGSAVPRIYGEDTFAPWSSIVDAVHAEGAAIFCQIWHVGAFHPSQIGMQDSHDKDVRRLSPSGLSAPGLVCGESMTQADIDTTIDNYATAASYAKRCGFDGVEIHGAHGYLPDQFFWPLTNNRTDRYNGSIAARALFSTQIVRECRTRCGGGFAISFRYSQWKQHDYKARIVASPPELAELLEPLVDAGVDLIHVSTRRFWEPCFEGSPYTLAAWTKKLSGVPVIAVGSVTLANDFKSMHGKIAAAPCQQHIEQIERALDDGDFDLIAIGRALLANPDWVNKLATGKTNELVPFDKSMLETLN